MEGRPAGAGNQAATCLNLEFGHTSRLSAQRGGGRKLNSCTHVARVLHAAAHSSRCVSSATAPSRSKPCRFYQVWRESASWQDRKEAGTAIFAASCSGAWSLPILFLNMRESSKTRAPEAEPYPCIFSPAKSVLREKGEGDGRGGLRSRSRGQKQLSRVASGRNTFRMCRGSRSTSCSSVQLPLGNRPDGCQ